MPSGAGAAGFGGGFAKGLASVLMSNRQAQAKKKSEEEERKDRLFSAMLPSLLENAESPADLESVFTERFPDLFGGTAGKSGGKGKAGGKSSPFEMIQHFIGPLLGKKQQAGGGPQVGNDLPSQGGITGNLPGRSLPMEVDPITGEAPTSPVVPPATAALAAGAPPPAVPVAAAGAPAAATRRTLFGVPLMSEEERATRDAKRITGREGAVATARVDVARRLLPQLQALDKNVTLEDALRYVSKGDLFNPYTGSTGGVSSVPGQVTEADGSTHPEFGIFDRKLQGYVYPAGHEKAGQTIPGFTPRTSTGSTNLGADREAKARELFNKPASALNSEEMAKVNAALPQFAGQMAEGRGLGSGRAKITTELNSPIGATAASLYNVPPTTTLAELSQTNTLRPEQQEKVASLGQVDQLLDDINKALPTVFPDVEEGIWGRLQSQFSLAMQKLAADDDLAKLDGAINASLAQVAQLSGQPGSRLSDKDIELAKSTLAELKPSVFGGDTLRTAKVRLGVLQRLLDKAKSAVPSKEASPGSTKAPAGAAPAAGGGAGGTGGATGATIKDGKLYVNGKEIG